MGLKKYFINGVLCPLIKATLPALPAHLQVPGAFKHSRNDAML